MRRKHTQTPRRQSGGHAKARAQAQVQDSLAPAAPRASCTAGAAGARSRQRLLASTEGPPGGVAAPKRGTTCYTKQRSSHAGEGRSAWRGRRAACSLVGVFVGGSREHGQRPVLCSKRRRLSKAVAPLDVHAGRGKGTLKGNKATCQPAGVFVWSFLPPLAKHAPTRLPRKQAKKVQGPGPARPARFRWQSAGVQTPTWCKAGTPNDCCNTCRGKWSSKLLREQAKQRQLQCHNWRGLEGGKGAQRGRHGQLQAEAWATESSCSKSSARSATQR